MVTTITLIKWKSLWFTDHATPLYPQTMTLTSPTSGGRSVGIVLSRTKATELVTLVTRLLQESS
jgi:hypothetical protein